MTPNELINRFPEAIIPGASAGVRKTVQYKITHPMYVVIDDGKCTVHEGLAPKADVSIAMKDDHLVALLKGELNGMTALMTGKLKIEGDMLLAQRLNTFFDRERALNG